MISIGPFTIVYDNPQEDIPKVLQLLGQIGRLKGHNAVRFDNGAAMRRTVATRPPPEATAPNISMADFMGRSRRPHV